MLVDFGFLAKSKFEYGSKFKYQTQQVYMDLNPTKNHI